jgi:hypothetical protein
MTGRHPKAMRHWMAILVSVLVGAAPAGQTAIDLSRVGPPVGAEAPAFTLTDHTGAARSLAGLLGPNGALLVFSRSADW